MKKKYKTGGNMYRKLQREEKMSGIEDRVKKKGNKI